MQNTNDTRRIPLAIVGMACRLPGADDLDQFWQVLAEGRCAVCDLPPERFDQGLYYDPKKGVRNKSYTRRGAFPANRRFDHQRCPISPELVRKADAIHLMMCQTAAEAFRHAGMDPLDLPLRNTGVYVGHTIGSGLEGDDAYALGIEETAECLRAVEGMADLPPRERDAIVDALVEEVRSRFLRRPGDDRDPASNMVAGIIAKGFGLTGPFMAVNAACASSLAALLLACRALQRGTIDMAVVGGASVCGADWLLLFSPAQSMSPTQSRPFDHRADGLIVAEGCVALIVKTLDRAVADGDPIWAVIRGLGVSSDGKGRSLWAPRSEGQIEAIRRAYASDAEMADLQYVEAHATATQLGDATEIASLTAALKGAFPPGKKIPTTSVKANVGHALEAAGLASLVKTVLSMHKGVIPRAVHVEKLNPNIDWQRAPVYVPLETTPWPAPAQGKPRRAGVNAFGIGGLNVHVVLDSYCGAVPATPPARPRDPDDEAVAVVGLGCVFPGARNASQYWDLLRSGRDARQSPPEGRGRPGFPLGGYVTGFQYDWRRHKIPPKQINEADPLQFMVLDAAEQALGDSGYDRKPFDRKRTGVIVGTEFVGDFTFRLPSALRLPLTARLLGEILRGKGRTPQRAAQIEAAFCDAFHARWPVLLDETGSFSASSLAVRIAKTLDLMGGGAALDSGATSGAAALSAAIDLLVSGDCDLMIWAAAQRNMTRAAYETLARSGLLADDPARGPFDRNGSGRLPGEGAGVLLLKRLSDARRDGDSIRAVLRGVEAVHDDAAHALRSAVARSSERARLGDPALVMTDASGVPEIDEPIVRAVSARQSRSARPEPVHLGSVVGQIGHTGGASVAASLLAAILALQEQTVPPVCGLHDPVVPLIRSGRVVRCADRPEPIGSIAGPATAAIVLSHDKGLVYAVALERGVAPSRAKPPASARARPSPADSTDLRRIAHRSVPRLVEAPVRAVSPTAFRPQGAAVVLGDHPAADTLARRLESQGAVVHRLRPGRGCDALLGEMDRLPIEPTPRHVFVLTALSSDGDLLDPASWPRRRKVGVELPYLVLQRWGQLLERNRVAGPFTLAAATLLGGDLGLAATPVAPEGGWMAGLLKSLGIELSRHDRPTRVKICDFAPGDAPDAIADAMLAELAADRPEVEVALGGGRRGIVRIADEPVEGLPRSELRRGAVWVVTGGARGITAEVSLALGRQYGLDLHLIGRSPAPRDDAPWRNVSDDGLKTIKRSIVRQAVAEGKSPEKQWDRVKHDIEIHDNLARMRRLGLRVAYHSCDVADWTALAKVLDAIRRSSGPIEGIIHGAGYARTSRFESQKREELISTIRAKVDGAVALMSLTRGDPLRYFVAFGSISGRFGGNGLSDYAGANAMLAKLCAWFRAVRPDCASSCIDWQSWDGVGMAMLPDSAVGARDVLKMQFIAPAEGIWHLHQELRAGLPEREVIVDDGRFERLLGPTRHSE